MTAPGVSFEEFRREVIRFEAEAAADPKRYRSRVAAFAMLGYIYLLIITVSVPALAVLALIWVWSLDWGAFWIGIAFPLALVWVTLIPMYWRWAPDPAPGAVLLSASEAPVLFDLIAQASRRVGAPAPDVVCLTWHPRFSMARRPMLGAFGPLRNYLLLSWPLMQVLSDDEFRSVLAHELSHISRMHFRLEGWIQGQDLTWAIIGGRLEGHNEVYPLEVALVRGFARWYVPKLAARVFVLDRAQESEADRSAVAFTSSRVATDALLRIWVIAPVVAVKLNFEWLREAERTPEMPGDFVSRMGAAMARPPAVLDVKTRMEKARATPTGYQDAHLSLADRLRRMGVANPGLVEYPGIRTRPAAGEVFLGDSNAAFGERLDRSFRERFMATWKARGESDRAERAALAELGAISAQRPLTPSESWSQVGLTYSLDGCSAAQPLAEAFLAGNPDHEHARFILGHALLDRGDAAGIEDLRTVIARDPLRRQVSAMLLFEHFWSRGQVEEAEVVRRIMESAEREDAAAALERNRVKSSEPLLAHGLPDAQIADLRQRLAAAPDLVEVCLVRRQLRIRPHPPAYLLLLKTLARRVSPGSPEAAEMTRLDRALVQRVMRDGDWPDGVAVMVVGPGRDPFLKQARKVPGAVLLKR